MIIRLRFSFTIVRTILRKQYFMEVFLLI